MRHQTKMSIGAPAARVINYVAPISNTGAGLQLIEPLLDTDDELTAARFAGIPAHRGGWLVLVTHRSAPATGFALLYGLDGIGV